MMRDSGSRAIGLGSAIGRAKLGLLVAVAIAATAMCIATLPARADTLTPAVGASVQDARIMLNDWPEGSTVHVTVDSDDNPANGTLCSGDVTMDDGTSTDFDNVGGTSLESLLAAGQYVTASQGATTKVLHILPLAQRGFDLASSTVTGTADPGTRVNVMVNNDSDLDWSVDATTDVSGVWAANLSSVHALVRGDEGNATITEPDGDWTETDWRIPNPNVWAAVKSNQISLEEWPAGSTVHVVLDSDNNPGNGNLFTQDVTVDGDGNGDVDQDAVGDHGGLAVGQYVTATGSVTKSLQITAVGVTSADIHNETVGGTATPGSHIRAWVDDQGSDATATASASGSWSIHIPDADIEAGDHGMAAVEDNDGDATRADWTATGLTIKPASSKVKRGKAITLSIGGQPIDLGGEWVRVDVKKPGKKTWSAVTNVVIPRVGSYRVTYPTTKKTAPGAYTFRVVYGGGWNDLMGSTETAKVTLKK